jgi:cellulose synthase operon protein C
LKKLHDLSPADQDVMNDLSNLLMELGDHKGMIQLYEDQILRGRDPAMRAELARKVASIWEEDIGDAREAADAWRRVLRMKAGDPDATAGLERAKTGKLNRRLPPPPVPEAPPPPPPESTSDIDPATAPRGYVESAAYDAGAAAAAGAGDEPEDDTGPQQRSD